VKAKFQVLQAIFLSSLIWTAVLWAQSAMAHEIRPAYLKLTTIKGTSDFEVTWKQPVRNGQRLRLTPVLPQSCKEVVRGLSEATPVSFIERWRISCETGLGGQQIAVQGLDRTLVDVFVEITLSEGSTQTTILKPNAPYFVVSAEGGSGNASYLSLGFEHLILGFDHILFIIALVLLIRTPLGLFKVVTSFTFAHSITLALATLGLVQLPQASVEAVIALSIVFLAVELIKSKEVKDTILLKYPWAITFVFGLLHGFGFAGALVEIGLPTRSAAAALFFFNVGIELGQLMIVGAILSAMALSRPLAKHWGLYDSKIPTYAIGTLAAYWFIDRTIPILSAGL
jgi:hydrogenase/urease accessory protein HupE